MTVVVPETHTETLAQARSSAAVPASPRDVLAPWHFRAGAFAVDVVVGAAVAATLALVSFSVPGNGAWWRASVCVLGAVILLMLVNRLLLPSIAGWSLGRGLLGIAVVRRDGEPAGPWRLLARDLAHLLDTASVVGWLWPLWDPRRRTFADMVLRTEARRVDPDQRPAGIRKWTAAAVLTAAVVCLAATAMSYVVVYSRDRASDQTRAQVEAQGPKMVAQMLTYDPKSLEDDFARARSLATDNYRGKLAAEQETAKKRTPVINEYWPRDGSVLSATPDRATMLLFLQGRRGTAPNERYISATVRVDFAKGGDGHWRVDNVTPLPGNGK